MTDYNNCTSQLLIIYFVLHKCNRDKSHHAWQQSEPLQAQQQSTTLESLHLLPPDGTQVVPAPSPSAHCLHGPAVETKYSQYKHLSSSVWYLAAASGISDFVCLSLVPLLLTRALLAVSHVGSTALRVTVPAVITWGNMAPYCPSSSNSLCLWETEGIVVYSQWFSSLYEWAINTT